MALPSRDPAQRDAALAKAAHVRQVRAGVKRLLQSGETTLAEVLDRSTTSEELAGMRVRDVLEALPHIGKVRARRLMERLHIAESRRLRGLGPRQREALLEALRR